MTTAREGLLDAFEEILVHEGERAATLDAVAARAHVSKGGLLYHFGSKAALIAGLVHRLDERAATDLDDMRKAPEGPAVHYVRTSAEVDGDFDRTLLAALALSQGKDAGVAESLRRIRTQWLDLIREDLGDDDAALAVLLMGDGLYADSLEMDREGEMGMRSTAPHDTEALLRVVERLRRPDPA